MMATVRHVTAWAGRTKFQTDGFLFVGVYFDRCVLAYVLIHFCFCFSKCNLFYLIFSVMYQMKNSSRFYPKCCV